MGWNPRYVNYARLHGNTPEEQKKVDEKEYWGTMIGFMDFMDKMWFKYRQSKGWTRDTPLSNKDHEEFDIWLSNLTREEL